MLLSIPSAALGWMGHLLKEGSEEILNLLGAYLGLVLLEVLLVRMEREVGELLATQKLH